ncbi:MAG TPA: excinuclease ABC subunit UvrC [Dehalococcoidia bacterium]|nr:excinuclease ABC subunit UvrC [Dehalococcoidia bacterium]
MPTRPDDNTQRARFASRLAALPLRSGVYIFRNEKGDVIYVGKAASLRNRVRNYFGAPHSLEPKTRALAEQVADLEYIVTQNAAEALHLEATLVKRHQPFFNVRLKDDKHYPYLRIDVQNEWPRVEIARRVQSDGARYFGPYASASSVRTTLSIVKKLFPWRSCTKTITGTDPRPCLDYFIHRCIAPCTAYCTKEEYDEVIRQTVLFLEGKTSEVLKSLRGQMGEASEAMQFEAAALFRDQIKAIESVAEKQFVERIRKTDEDVFGLARDPSTEDRAGDEGCVQVFFIRGTQMVGRDFFTLDGVRGEADGDVLGSFIKQFYESAVYVPKIIVLPFHVPEETLIAEWLTQRRGSKVTIAIAQRGVRRRMVELATENARESLDMLRVRWLADSEKRDQALSELQEELDLPTYPRRIECYDNSNIQGASPVASMVVFIDGQPKPSEYRRFRIKTVEGANDFASMAEVLGRRFKRWEGTGVPAEGSARENGAPSESASPEAQERGTGAQPLTGGMGGVLPSSLLSPNPAEQRESDVQPDTRVTPESASAEAQKRGTGAQPLTGGMGGVPPSSLSPNTPEQRVDADTPDDDDDGLSGWGALPDLVIVDGGKGQLSASLDVMRNLGLKDVPLAGLAKQNEELFVQDLAEPIVLPRTSQALYLVQRIRDEAHRFAITYHRKLRSKTGMESALDSVPGVGPKRKKALLRKFGSLKGIREAPVDEIASTVGFTVALATKVKEHL